MKPVLLLLLSAAICCLPLGLSRAQTGPATPPLAGPEVEATPSIVDSTHTATLRDEQAGHLFADIETSKGQIEAELDFQHAPLTTMNFVGLAEGTLPFQGRPPGTPFYDGTTFHRVVKDFVIQGGDPSSADPAFPVDKLGDGGPGYSFPDEFSPKLRHDMAGVLSMANDGPDTNGSQFFITLRDVNRLNYLHSVFGQVVRGMDVVNRIEPGDKILRVRIRRTGVLVENSSAVSASPTKEQPALVGAFTATADRFGELKKRTVDKRQTSNLAGLDYLLDETKKLPDFRVKNFNYQLANYERTTGHRIVVRVLTEFKPDPPDETIGNAVKKLSRAINLPDTGDNVLVCYFAASDAWAMRLGEATYPALIGETGTTEQLMANGALHRRKLELLAGAQALSKDEKLKEAVDAAIETVIKTFDDFELRQTAPDTR